MTPSEARALRFRIHSRASPERPWIAETTVPTPAGRPFTQRTAVRWAAEPWLVFACGRYEGIDQRVIDDAARKMPVPDGARLLRCTECGARDADFVVTGERR